MNIDLTQVLVTFIGGLPLLIAAITTLIVSLRTQTQIVTLKEHVNSKMDQLLEVTKEAEGLAGEKRGREAEQERVK